MTRVVADTNIYISALMFGGLPGMLLNLGLMQAIRLVISPALLDELQDKLRVKFGVLAQDAAAIRAKLESFGDLIDPAIVLDVVTDDPDDNRVLECAVTGWNRKNDAEATKPRGSSKHSARHPDFPARGHCGRRDHPCSR